MSYLFPGVRARTPGPFRTGRTLAEHGQALAQIREQQRTAFGNIDSLADAVGSPGERSISQRLDTIERVLFALARAQGIDPDAAG
ncbi:hypothetical protein [Streptomyces mirabilis]|uniref:hypothetical protein n=1 Tax=Streptomyces mirabilis TaxID=68239 RepID=UPI0037F3FF32